MHAVFISGHFIHDIMFSPVCGRDNMADGDVYKSLKVPIPLIS